MFNDFLPELFYIVTQLGGTAIAVLVFLITAYFLWRGRPTFLKYYVVFFAINELVVYILKNLIDKQRPVGAIIYGESDGSIPSGHAAVAIFLYGFICFLVYISATGEPYKRLLMGFLLSAIVLIGWSRLYLGVHFLIDVVAGYLIGGIFLWLLILKLRSLKNS